MSANPMSGDPAEVVASIRKQFREDYEFAIGPLRDTARSEFEGALKFAESGIRSLFSLNGGGLIALPAFAALFKPDMHGSGRLIFLAMAMFVAGLIKAAVTCLLGYLSAMKGKEAADHTVTAMSIKYATHYLQISTTPATAAEIKAAENAAARCTARSILLRVIAIGVSILSLVGFIAGACLAALALAPT